MIYNLNLFFKYSSSNFLYIMNEEMNKGIIIPIVINNTVIVKKERLHSGLQFVSAFITIPSGKRSKKNKRIPYNTMIKLIFFEENELFGLSKAILKTNKKTGLNNIK